MISRSRLTAIAALGAVAVGGVLRVAGQEGPARVVWAGGILVMLIPLGVSVARSLLAGDVGVDLVALIAMVGTLLVGEELAGAVIAVMLAGGNALEDAARRRAGRELAALVSRVPLVAHRRVEGGFEDAPVGEIVAGDVVVVRAGEVVAVDGTVLSEVAVIDESALTGESLPVSLARHQRVRSGASNAGDPFELRASCPAAESAYASLVRLVENAQGQRAPFVRLADRYAIWFLALTVVVSGAGWITSGSAVTAVAVLVVATPCPLILAAPIALASGISRAARRGIIIKGGAVIEQLGAARTVLFDKTGTLTYGAPEIAEIVVAGDVLPDRLLAAVASLEQHSVHVVAEALVRAAVARGLTLTEPTDVHESPGDGIAGTVAGQRVAAGSASFIVAHTGGAARPGESAPGRASVHVALEGQPGGSIILADRLRDDARELVSTLHSMGVGHVAMVTGDRADVARLIGDEVGVDAVYAEQTPEAKLEVVRAIRARPELCAVVMVGDGVNDAPALTLASVGIAMAGRGATVSSETADAVITVDRVDRVADAIAIGRRSMAIARQSVLAGMALSIVAMAVAAAGYLPPVEGALLQELIDVAVIANALRALR